MAPPVLGQVKAALKLLRTGVVQSQYRKQESHSCSGVTNHPTETQAGDKVAGKVPGGKGPGGTP